MKDYSCITVLAGAGSLLLAGTAFAGPGTGDECTDPLVAVDGNNAGTTVDNTGAVDDTSCTFGDNIDEWWIYTATCDGNLTVTTCNAPSTNYDTALAAFDSCGGAELACNDDSPGGFDPDCDTVGIGLNRGSTITFPVSAGTDYLIRVAGFADNVGDYVMTITCTPFGIEACCFNDGSCQDLPVGDCTDQGGTPQGAGSTCAATVCPIPDLVSSDGMWRAQLDPFGQVENFFPSAQPSSDNVFETLVYVASTFSGLVSERIETTWAVTEGPAVSPDLTSSHTRLEHPSLMLSVEIDNTMIPGPNGGVRVQITCENKSSTFIDCKVFYYVDLDISGDFSDDEAQLITNADGSVLAIQQGDNGEATIKPLWFGGCKPYKSWSVQTFSGLRAALDAGLAQLDSLDSTTPGPADHTAALSGEFSFLEPGGSATTQFGIGAPDFNGCKSDCPADLTGDGIVNAADLAQLLGAWGPVVGCPPGIPGDADFNDDCIVNAADLAQLLGAWGPCP